MLDNPRKSDRLKYIKLKDKAFSAVISFSGILIILCLISIITVIFLVAVPLFKSASSEPPLSFTYSEPSAETLMILGSSDPQKLLRILADGTAELYDVVTGEVTYTEELPKQPDTEIIFVEANTNGVSYLTDDWALRTVEFSFPVNFDSAVNETRLAMNDTSRNLIMSEPFFSDAAHRLIRDNGDDFLIYVETAGNKLMLHQFVTATSLFGAGETTTSLFEYTVDPVLGNISALTSDRSGKLLYVATDQGMLQIFSYDDGLQSYRSVESVSLLPQGITSINMIYGDSTLVAGDNEGNLAFLNIKRDQSAPSGFAIKKIHPGETSEQPANEITVPALGKNFALVSDRLINIRNMTSGRDLLSLPYQSDFPPIFNRNFDRLFEIRGDRLFVTRFDLAYFDFSLRALFSKVQYENYGEPEYIWQSSAGNDDFEPKYSLIPLIFGSFKATLYSMLFAFPLAVVGGIYTAMFMVAGLKKYIKPSVEIMASLPSVIIGFLAGLWLAPLVSHWLLPMVLFILIFPLSTSLSYVALSRTVKKMRPGLFSGYEFIWILPAVIVTAWLSASLGQFVESSYLNGDATQWLFETFGLRYDQRNSIVIAFALGFTMIPIVFTITEDSVSNIPNQLIASSLALGATHWQTMLRVVLPSAAPGIFAALIIGFGRAIGETMIVLMATGNTPIMSADIFSGMRTLSANIAVEIPEAPQGESLYRILFFSAVVLFAMTFVLNLIADFIRQKLRKKYAYS